MDRLLFCLKFLLTWCCCVFTITFIILEMETLCTNTKSSGTKETNTVSCGALSLQRYTEMTPDNFFSKVTDGKHLVVKSGEHYVQSLNKAGVMEFDTSFIATYKLFMKLQYKAFVASIPSKVVNNYCRRWYGVKSINTTILNMVNQRIDIINQTIADGNSNIYPLLFSLVKLQRS